MLNEIVSIIATQLLSISLTSGAQSTRLAHHLSHTTHSKE